MTDQELAWWLVENLAGIEDDGGKLFNIYYCSEIDKGHLIDEEFAGTVVDLMSSKQRLHYFEVSRNDGKWEVYFYHTPSKDESLPRSICLAAKEAIERNSYLDLSTDDL